MNNLSDIEISTFEAKCQDCQKTFDHPSFGDHAYGKFIFCSEDGRYYVYFNDLVVSKIFQVLLPENCGADIYQSALAEFSNPIFGKKLKAKVQCPNCSSSNLAYWHGKKTGSIWIKPANYSDIFSLKRSDLIQKFTDYANRIE